MNESGTRLRWFVLLVLTLWACVMWLENSDVAQAATGDATNVTAENR